MNKFKVGDTIIHRFYSNRIKKVIGLETIQDRDTYLLKEEKDNTEVRLFQSYIDTEYKLFYTKRNRKPDWF